MRVLLAASQHGKEGTHVCTTRLTLIVTTCSGRTSRVTKVTSMRNALILFKDLTVSHSLKVLPPVSIATRETKLAPHKPYTEHCTSLAHSDLLTCIYLAFRLSHLECRTFQMPYNKNGSLYLIPSPVILLPSLSSHH